MPAKKKVVKKSVKKRVSAKRSEEALTFGKAFKFPFNNWKRLFNILWVLLPIFGWFALGGYMVRIVRGFVRVEFDGLPKMEFGSDMALGAIMFLKALPFLFLYLIVSIALEFTPGVGPLLSLFIGVLVFPILTVNFIVKGTVGSFFKFGLVGDVFNNFGDYAVAWLKELGLGLVFAVLILVLVGIPALVFTPHIFIADFYRRKILK
jgi:uncharacterized membrane protein